MLGNRFFLLKALFVLWRGEGIQQFRDCRSRLGGKFFLKTEMCCLDENGHVPRTQKIPHIRQRFPKQQNALMFQVCTRSKSQLRAVVESTTARQNSWPYQSHKNINHAGTGRNGRGDNDCDARLVGFFRRSHEKSELLKLRSLPENGISAFVWAIQDALIVTDLRKIDVDCITLGQYMQPTRKHLKVNYDSIGKQVGELRFQTSQLGLIAETVCGWMCDGEGTMNSWFCETFAGERICHTWKISTLGESWQWHGIRIHCKWSVSKVIVQGRWVFKENLVSFFKCQPRSL